MRGIKIFIRIEADNIEITIGEASKVMGGKPCSFHPEMDTLLAI